MQYIKSSAALAAVLVFLLCELAQGQVYQVGGQVFLEKLQMNLPGELDVCRTWTGGDICTTLVNGVQTAYSLSETGPPVAILTGGVAEIQGDGIQGGTIYPKSNGLYFLSMSSAQFNGQNASFTSSWVKDWITGNYTRFYSSNDIITVKPAKGGTPIVGKLWFGSAVLPFEGANYAIVGLIDVNNFNLINFNPDPITYQGFIQVQDNGTLQEIFPIPAGKVVGLPGEAIIFGSQFSMDENGINFIAGETSNGSSSAPTPSKIVRYYMDGSSSILFAIGLTLNGETVTGWTENAQIPLDTLSGDFIVSYQTANGARVARFVGDQPEITAVGPPGDSFVQTSYNSPYMSTTTVASNGGMATALIGQGQTRTMFATVNGLFQVPDGTTSPWVGGIVTPDGCSAFQFTSNLGLITNGWWLASTPCVTQSPIGVIEAGSVVKVTGHNLAVNGFATTVVDTQTGALLTVKDVATDGSSVAFVAPAPGSHSLLIMVGSVASAPFTLVVSPKMVCPGVSDACQHPIGRH